MNRTPFFAKSSRLGVGILLSTLYAPISPYPRSSASMITILGCRASISAVQKMARKQPSTRDNDIGVEIVFGGTTLLLAGNSKTASTKDTCIRNISSMHSDENLITM